MTPRPPESATRATALAISSGSRVESTWATDGAVRPKPISRVVVVGMSVLNIVKEGTAWPGDDAGRLGAVEERADPAGPGDDAGRLGAAEERADPAGPGDDAGRLGA